MLGWEARVSDQEAAKGDGVKREEGKEGMRPDESGGRGTKGSSICPPDGAENCGNTSNTEGIWMN